MSFLESAISSRGFGKNLIELPNDRIPKTAVFGFIILAYLLSFWVRLEWIDYAQANYLNDQGETVFLHLIWSRMEWHYPIPMTVFILEVLSKSGTGYASK